MKHSLCALICLLLVLVMTSATAKIVETPQPVDAATDAVLVGGGSGQSKTDTFSIYFEDFESGPAGWTTHDLTVGSSYWNVSTFNASNLDPLVPGNSAWWCGEELTSCDGLEPEGGYGPHYDTSLVWSHTPPVPDASVLVNITADLNHDLEPGYDYLYLEYLGSGGWVAVDYWNGIDFGIPVDLTFTLAPGDFIDGEVQLRWRVESDAAADAADCGYPNDGAAQIDNIAVSFNGSLVGAVEDCEGPTSWIPQIPLGVGDFAQLMNFVEDIDPCPDNLNNTWRWVFVDDGVIVPGTGGYTGAYGPGVENYVVNPVGGLLGPDHHIHNEIWSPPIPWDNGLGYGAILAYDCYLDLCASYGCSGIFSNWSVRSTDDPTADPVTNPEAWGDWVNDNFYWYGVLYNKRRAVHLSEYLVENCAQIQISLGVVEIGYIWGFTGTDATPAPYYDNVEILQYDGGPYMITARPQNMAQDSFASDLDELDPTQHSLRFDAALNIATTEDGVDRGDSIAVLVEAIIPDAPALNRVDMLLKHKRNPLYDTYRSVPLGDHVQCWTGLGDYYIVDLPDTGCFFPGDIVHYCFKATGSDASFVLMPDDTTGFSDFSLTSPYPRNFTWRGLPTVSNLAEMTTPKTLLWDDSGLVGTSNAWREALIATGLMPGIGYDTYRTTAPWYNMGNGIGYVGTDILTVYDTILYAGGFRSGETLEEADVTTLDAFLLSGDKCVILSGNHTVSALSATPAGDAFLTTWLGVSSSGEDVGAAIGSGGLSVAQIPGNGVFDDGDNWTVDGGCYITFDEVTVGDAGSLAEFEPAGTYPYTAASLNEVPGYSATTFVFPYDLNYVGEGADYLEMSAILEDVFISLDYGPVASLLQACEISSSNGGVDARWKVSVPAEVSDFRLTASTGNQSWSVEDIAHSGAGFIARDESPLLRPGEIILYALHYRAEDDMWREILSTDVEIASTPRATTLLGAHPNPFNPNTEIAFSVDRPQAINISIYDVTGRRIIELVRGTVEAGNHTVMWNGQDTDGRRISSGTYFIRMEKARGVESQKITLVK